MYWTNELIFILLSLAFLAPLFSFKKFIFRLFGTILNDFTISAIFIFTALLLLIIDHGVVGLVSLLLSMVLFYYFILGMSSSIRTAYLLAFFSLAVSGILLSLGVFGVADKFAIFSFMYILLAIIKSVFNKLFVKGTESE